jgi:hypothetical protein
MLDQLRAQVIKTLNEGKINEAQYEMLDKKISDYIDKINNSIINSQNKL